METIPERIVGYFVVHPGAAASLGRTLILSALVGFVAYAWGLFATGSLSALAIIAHSAPPAISLAAMYPTLPTWWIPESIFGLVPYILLSLIGYIIFWYGKTLDRLANAP